MADVAQSLQLLFDRPGEPMLTPKGDENALFLLSKEFLPKDFENIGLEINNRFSRDASQTIPLQNLKQLPSFPKASKLPADADFSIFLPAHQEMADEVIDILMGVPENNLQQFLSTCVFSRVNLNAQLFNYCYSVALMHRRDTRNVPVNNYAETFPANFVYSKVFAQARESAAVATKGGPRTPVVIPRDYTANDLDIEHRVAYWREDLGINLHHWHWHLVYPFSSTIRAIVDKDRRGELFFYMHQQVIARYNCERLNNALARVKKFSNFREPVAEAYFPKLDSLTSARGWPPRQANMRWHNLNRPADGLVITIDTMEKWRRNIEEVIATGIVQKADGTTQDLDIDTLGNIIESSILSPNRELYGNLHNLGHSFAGYMHDPENRYLEPFAVMASEATNMRDPIFYIWHAFIDDFFQRFKESSHVNRYLASELENPGVTITSVNIVSTGYDDNVLNTFWMQSDIDMSRGLDFSDRGPVYVRFTHLNHRPFSYDIKVNNTGNAQRATVRIFMAPKFDERQMEWMLSEQRKMFIEMDRFVVRLKKGKNTITRTSEESELTIPFEQTFRNLRAEGGQLPSEAYNFCGCGWPQHMLVPRGTEVGAPYQLFVMLSDYEQDKIEQPDGSKSACVEASSFCGLRDKKYPDKRAMGFPFDRPSSTAEKIKDFILPNMALTDITVRLQDVVEKNPRNLFD
ncbi:phenoloxidase subunit 2-like [Epargyreus clarus]|uniref:phenoloxidase subunit 2-like n=1 Tax=Epargyreus clarus TaxID=520877 RepID=UPI003C2EF1AA